MFPIAGVIVWIALGSIIGWLAGKVTATGSPNGVMANTGVGMVAAIVTGFVVTAVSGGEQSTNTFWLAIVFAALSSVIAVSVYRLFVRDRSATIR